MIAQPGMPWLTVVMPVHCGEAWIDATLASLEGEADDRNLRYRSLI
jgi:hypothetical protein